MLGLGLGMPESRDAQALRKVLWCEVVKDDAEGLGRELNLSGMALPIE